MQRNKEEKNWRGLRFGEKKYQLHVLTLSYPAVRGSYEFLAIFKGTSIRINLIKEANTFSAAFIFYIWLKPGS